MLRTYLRQLSSYNSEKLKAGQSQVKAIQGVEVWINIGFDVKANRSKFKSDDKILAQTTASDINKPKTNQI